MDNLFTQEIEVGLPYRFGIAIENEVEHFNHETVNANFSIEGRWALADWGKIPLNPTIFAEYKFGTGRIFHEEGPEEETIDDEPKSEEEEEMMMEEEARMNRPATPTSFGCCFRRKSPRMSNGLSTLFLRKKTPAIAAASGVSRKASRCRFFFRTSA